MKNNDILEILVKTKEVLTQLINEIEKLETKEEDYDFKEEVGFIIEILEEEDFKDIDLQTITLKEFVDLLDEEDIPTALTLGLVRPMKWDIWDTSDKAVRRLFQEFKKQI